MGINSKKLVAKSRGMELAWHASAQRGGAEERYERYGVEYMLKIHPPSFTAP
jgi:hypothetical protein